MILNIDEEREDDRGRAPNLDGDVEVHAGRLCRGQSEHQSESALGADCSIGRGSPGITVRRRESLLEGGSPRMSGPGTEDPKAAERIVHRRNRPGGGGARRSGRRHRAPWPPARAEPRRVAVPAQRPGTGITGHSNIFTGALAIDSMPAAAYVATCSALVSWTGVTPAVHVSGRTIQRPPL